MKRLAILAGALALAASLSGCEYLKDIPADQRKKYVDLLFAELNKKVDKLQAMDIAEIETSPIVLIAVDGVCTAIGFAIPPILAAINKDSTLAPENQASLDEALALRDGVCATVDKILIDKTTSDPAPVVAPLPVPNPVG